MDLTKQKKHQVLGIALPDTFGTPAFLDAFRKPIPEYTSAGTGAVSTTASGPDTTIDSTIESEAATKPPISAPVNTQDSQRNINSANKKTYAHVYSGVRQDSGEPANFVKMVREFYNKEGITGEKVIVFSDSLNIENCLEYKVIAEESGFKPVFGVGTFFTSMLLPLFFSRVQRIPRLMTADDFTHKSTGEKSKPLNIVIKIASANGRPAVKLSDNMGKNTGDKDTVEQVKKALHYIESTWKEVDESNRWT